MEREPSGGDIKHQEKERDDRGHHNSEEASQCAEYQGRVVEAVTRDCWGQGG